MSFGRTRAKRSVPWNVWVTLPLLPQRSTTRRSLRSPSERLGEDHLHPWSVPRARPPIADVTLDDRDRRQGRNVDAVRVGGGPGARGPGSASGKAVSGAPNRPRGIPDVPVAADSIAKDGRQLRCVLADALTHVEPRSVRRNRERSRTVMTGVGWSDDSLTEAQTLCSALRPSRMSSTLGSALDSTRAIFRR
jgi:hypothetical protein